MPTPNFRILVLFLLCGAALSGVAQNVPDSISYQAVVRDAFGNQLVNQSVTIEFAIHSGTPQGTVVYEENHDLLTTNQFGLFTAMIGNGTITGNGLYNSMHSIPWEQGVYFLEVRATIPGQGSTQLLGISQMLTVPYAYYAAKAGSVLVESDGDTQNELIDDFSLSGTTLTITENNADYSVDLSGLVGAADNDGDSSNELIQDIAIDASHNLVINESGTDHTVDLSPVAYETWNENANAVYNENQNVGIGTSTPNSTLQVDGSVSVGFATLTGGLYDFTLDNAIASKAVYLCNVQSADVSIQLVSAATCPGRIYKFRKYFTGITTSNDVNLAPVAGEFVDGQPIYGMNSIYAEYLTLMSDGINWVVIDHSHE